MRMQEAEEIYRTYSPQLYRYLCSLTHSPADAEDLLSETFLRALTKLPGFRGDSSVRTWLFAIARNVWLEHIRKTRDTLGMEELMEAYVEDCVLEDVSAGILMARVRECLAGMEERTRRIVQMRSEGYSYEEIGAELQITASSARVIEHRARKKLREQLIEEGLINA
ncbi:MAG: RNA polymerase sigma factor [Eubacteriales bacterium]|nr:RNA polymerase sigma factor [Eubacteriales bacterium]